MNIAQPIRATEDLEKMKEYYRIQSPNCRNELLIVMGLNTALRISDILSLQWKMVYNFEGKEYLSHIFLTEQKTGKASRIYMNQSIREMLSKYMEERRHKKLNVEPCEYLFRHSNKNIPITRVQAFRIIKEAAEGCDIPGVICCHSLRKTFGYHAWKQGFPPVLLMNIFNHSSYQITKRYLGIEQDDRDQIFEKINL